MPLPRSERQRRGRGLHKALIVPRRLAGGTGRGGGRVGTGLWLLDAVAHELLLFAAVGLVIGGIDDLAVDLIFFARRGWRNLRVYRRHGRAAASTLPPPARPGRIAVFVGAWDEAGVIGGMLGAARERWGKADYRIYVGTYPNDPGTAAEIRHRFGDDPRIRVVPGLLPGPCS